MVKAQIPSAQEIAALDPAIRATMAAAYMAGIEPGRYPFAFFEQLARLAVLSTVELVAFDRTTPKDNPNVLLTQRPATDPWWKHQWHVMGTVISPADEVVHDDDIDFGDPNFSELASYNPVLERLLTTGELNEGGIQIVEGPFLSGARCRKGIRGPESTVRFCAGVVFTDSEPRQGELFEAASVVQTPPPGGLIVGHAFAIRQAAKTYAA